LNSQRGNSKINRRIDRQIHATLETKFPFTWRRKK